MAKKRKLVPMENQVIILRDEAEERTKGGILIPDTAKERPHWGKVVAVGPGKDGKEALFAVDDVVLFNKYSGAEIKMPGEEDSYQVVTWDNVLCKLE